MERADKCLGLASPQKETETGIWVQVMSLGGMPTQHGLEVSNTCDFKPVFLSGPLEFSLAGGFLEISRVTHIEGQRRWGRLSPYSHSQLVRVVSEALTCPHFSFVLLLWQNMPSVRISEQASVCEVKATTGYWQASIAMMNMERINEGTRGHTHAHAHASTHAHAHMALTSSHPPFPTRTYRVFGFFFFF